MTVRAEPAPAAPHRRECGYGSIASDRGIVVYSCLPRCHTGGVDVWSDAERVLATINSELEAEGDKARIRYMDIESDSYHDQKYVVLSFWELPDLNRSQKTWPLDTLDRYINMVDDHFAARLSDRFVDSTRSMCWFRTRDELEESEDGRPVYRSGRPVRALTQLS